MSSKINVTIEKFPASYQVKISYRDGKGSWSHIFSVDQYNAIRESIVMDAEIDGLIKPTSDETQTNLGTLQK